MNKVIIIGDSTHNTLSAVRSFGESHIPLTLILVCYEDVCFVQHSKYLSHGNLYVVKELDDCLPILKLLEIEKGQILMTTFDAAAEWVDAKEPELSKMFLTPCRGKQLGNLFSKDIQCKLAKECGLDVPFSIIYNRGDILPIEELVFPLITKPLVSSAGSKEDIHICKNLTELTKALHEESRCERFLLQQFLEKEYEINCLGVRTDKDVYIGGGIKKLRHWPKVTGASTFAIIKPAAEYKINIDGIKMFLEKSHYYGTFSAEFLHVDNKNYFLEINFRNDGLAYTSTCAGWNLHALYADSSKESNCNKFHPTYMMNYSIDFLHVKTGDITLWQWFKDVLKTRCFINICFSDLGPILHYYLNKNQ